MPLDRQCSVNVSTDSLYCRCVHTNCTLDCTIQYQLCLLCLHCISNVQRCVEQYCTVYTVLWLLHCRNVVIHCVQWCYKSFIALSNKSHVYYLCVMTMYSSLGLCFYWTWYYCIEYCRVYLLLKSSVCMSSIVLYWVVEIDIYSSTIKHLYHLWRPFSLTPSVASWDPNARKYLSMLCFLLIKLQQVKVFSNHWGSMWLLSTNWETHFITFRS